MEIELYEKGVLDRIFFNRPDFLDELRSLRIVEPYTESPDRDMRVIPGDRRDLLAIPHCGVDGNSTDPWYIDLRVDNDNGATYIGATLFHHLANLVGYAPVDELRQANTRIVELEAEVVRLTKLTSRLRIVRNELDDLESTQTTGISADSSRSRKAHPSVAN